MKDEFKNKKMTFRKGCYGNRIYTLFQNSYSSLQKFTNTSHLVREAEVKLKSWRAPVISSFHDAL